MQYVVKSVRKPGVSNKELIEHFTARMNPKAWELVRTDKVKHLYYLLGEEPGFFAIVDAESIEQVKTTAAEVTDNHNLFDIEVVPVSIFPEFPAE